MKSLLSDTYFPFGTQYYRAPSPDKRDWENDHRHMAELGFNIVKYWIQWRWNHPEVDRFFFDDIDRLMDLALKYRLKVMLNTIFDVAPAWIYTKYPDASMITLDGRKIGPQTQPHRQIGGLGYCLNNPSVTKHQFRFLSETVRRYRDHPALEIWNVGSEPELTASMAELRLYADNADKINDMLCYCEHCRKAFREWLEAKYKAIEQLNSAWNRNYRNFEEAEIPRTRNTFNDLIDWRMFFVHTLGENVKTRFEIAAKTDNGKHPLMCHHVFIQGFPLTSTANDPWNVGKYGDLHGFTQMDDTMMIDVLRSCAKDKPVISAEMLMLPGYTLNLPAPIDVNDVKRFIFSGIAGNLKGFIFWQFRPEILGREAPAWGLTYLDGSTSPWLDAFAQVGRILQKHAAFLLEARPSPAKTAIIYHPENQIYAWASTGNEKSATDSMLGAHRALYERNYMLDFIHPAEITGQLLKNYKLIYAAFPYVLNQSLADTLREWVQEGGLIISESYFAGWNLEQGHHQTIVPGYGFDRVFKIRQSLVRPVNSENGIFLFPKSGLRYIRGDCQIPCTLVAETFFTQGAEILASYDNGEPAITLASYGKGNAIYIGTYPGLNYHRTRDSGSADLITSMAQMAGIVYPDISDDKKVRVDTLSDKNGRKMMIIQNLECTGLSVHIDLKNSDNSSYREQFTGELLQVEEGKFTIELAQKEVKVFCD